MCRLHDLYTAPLSDCIRSLRSHSYCFYKNVDKENVLVVVVSSW